MEASHFRLVLCYEANQIKVYIARFVYYITSDKSSILKVIPIYKHTTWVGGEKIIELLVEKKAHAALPKGGRYNTRWIKTFEEKENKKARQR